MSHDPALQTLIERVNAARAGGTTLCIEGGGTKRFYGEAPLGEVLDTRALAGISSYEPTELVAKLDAVALPAPAALVQACASERARLHAAPG